MPNNQVVRAQKPFDEVLYGLFINLFKAHGSTPTVAQMESIRDSCKKMSKAINIETQLAALAHVKTLQKRIHGAMVEMEKELQMMKRHISYLEKLPHNIKVQ